MPRRPRNDKCRLFGTQVIGTKPSIEAFSIAAIFSSEAWHASEHVFLQSLLFKDSRLTGSNPIVSR